ncbi:beta strand repeat-containing protein [Paraburkholderia sp. DGU8]|uniref:beta strand repeat-containing protein n=1 Tax=Paraburkholderia sp. DGU8 TaxID=3161997 RepID=UPI0034654BDC
MDSITGTTGNTVFNADQTTLSAADTVKGTGANNVFNYTDSGTTGGNIAAAQVSGVQTINVRNVNGTAATAGTKEAATVTFGAVTNGQTVTLGGVTFTDGGTGSTGAQVAAFFAANLPAGYTVTSSTGSTLVFTSTATGNVPNLTLGGTGVATQSIVVVDGTAGVGSTGVADVINASNFAGATAFNSNLSSNDLTVNNLATGQSAGLIGNGTMTNGNLTANYAAAVTAGTLNVSGGTKGGAITETGASLTSTTINSTGAANKLGGLTLAATNTGLTINASTNLTTGAISDAALKTVTVTGAAALVDLSGAALSSTVTTVDASGMTAGGVKFTNGSAGLTFKGGANNNFVSTGGIVLNSTASVNAGTGTGNTLDITAMGDVATAAVGALYKGFNTLQVESGVAQDASLLAANNTITAAVVNGGAIAGAATVTSLTNLASGAGVTIQNSANATAGAVNTIDYSNAGSSLTLGIKGATTVGQIDTLNVTVNDSVAAGAAAGSSIVKVGALTAAGIENVAFHVVNAGDTLNISALTGMGAASSITFDGAGAVSLTTGAVAPAANTVIDAHSLSGAFTLDASLATTNALAIKGSVGANTITLQNTAVAGDVVDLSANVKGGSTVNTSSTSATVGTGNATITLGAHAAADTINVTDGAFIDGGTGAFSLVNGFSLGSTAATSDILKFSTATNTAITETIATAGTFTAAQTGVANLTATTASGLITFAGSALSTATVAQLISAAEKVVVGAIDTVAAFVNGGNTYVVESTHGGTLGAASTHVVELVGVSATSIGTAAGAGVVHIA